MRRLLVALTMSASAIPLGALAQEPVRLAAGFQPDPTTVQVTAGGPRDSSTLGECYAGGIPERPSAVVNYAGPSRPLNFSVMAERDTTLAVRTPDGRWVCNDDGAQGLNPEVLFSRAAVGEYQVFVGLFGDRSRTAPATLRISETLRAELRPGEQPFDPSDGEEGPPEQQGVQQIPDVNARPGRTASLAAGFRPDPTTFTIQAGGDRNSGAIGTECFAGLLPAAPTLRLTYRAGRRPLTITSRSEVDTTLAVRGPDGAWTCVDDSALGLDPQVSYARPRSGRYDVFVGRFNVVGQTAPARLQISNRPPARPPVVRPIAPDLAPDPRLAPTARSLSLSSGFRPDPARIPVRAGGDRSPVRLGDGCHGVVSAAPSVRLTYRAGSRPLSFGATGDRDTTLLVRGPDGRWACNDDFDGVNPRVTFDRPASGRYDIWVGRFNSRERSAAVLTITETPPPPPTPELVETEGEGLVTGRDEPPTPDAPAAAEASLRPGFQPDPWSVRVHAGGDRSGARASGTCNGVISAAPQLRLRWAGGSGPLTFSAVSEADTTLAIRAPGGEWRCNDDADGLNPRVTFEPAAAGAFEVYVGRFNSTEPAEAELRVTERRLPAPSPSAGD